MITSETISRKPITPFCIFACLTLLGFAGYLLCSALYGVDVTRFFLMENTDLRFCDLRMHVGFVANPSQLYIKANNETGCFPPLSYLMYYIISRMLSGDGHAPGHMPDIDKTDFLGLVIVYYSIFAALLLLIGILIYADGRIERSLLCFICVMFSVPFYAGGVSVANSTLIVMALLLIALNLRERDSSVLKELALFLIAICVGFKIYPAIFGLLYLLERRYKESVRLVIYSLILFFVPFSFFGGVDGFLHWLNNLGFTIGFDRFGRIQCIRGLFYTLADILNLSGDLTGFGLKIIPVLFLLIMLTLATTSRSRYRRIFFLCAVMTFFPTNAYRYTLTYLSIPFIMLFMEEPDTTGDIWSNIETFIFSLVYAIPVPLGLIMHFMATYEIYTLTYVEGWLYAFAYLLLFCVFMHDIVDFIIYKKNRFTYSINLSRKRLSKR